MKLISAMVLEKTLESLLDCKEIQPVHPEGNRSWIFIGRTDAEAEAEASILWPPDANNWLIRRPWCWEKLKAEGEGDDRGWDGWMASPTQGHRVWSCLAWDWSSAPPLTSVVSSASHFPCLWYDFLICKLGDIIAPSSLRCWEDSVRQCILSFWTESVLHKCWLNSHFSSQIDCEFPESSGCLTSLSVPCAWYLVGAWYIFVQWICFLLANELGICPWINW